ncbi:MAG: lysophospholipid acyltransferase family protein [Pseudomonadota bacterium]
MQSTTGLSFSLKQERTFMPEEKKPNRARRIRIAFRIISLLPLPLMHALASVAGQVMSFFPNSLRRVSLVNIALCYPDLSRGKQRKMMRKSLRETCKTLAEFGALRYWKKSRIDKLVVEVYDEDVIENAVAENKGVLVAAPHFGSWELAGVQVCKRFPMTVLFRPSRIEDLNPFLINVRKRNGIKTEPIDASGIKKIVMALAKGEAVGMLPDQEPKRGNGTFAKLFKQPAYTPLILSKIGARKQVPVVFVAMERLSFGRGFAMHYLRADNSKIYAANPEVAAREINRCVERCISIAPEQYMWNYKRFRTLPDGSLRNYKKAARESVKERWELFGVPVVDRVKSKVSRKKRRYRRRSENNI